MILKCQNFCLILCLDRDLPSLKLMIGPFSENETKKEELNVPVLTIISLGGNDYNHQNGKVPSQEETSQGFARFISEKIGLNNENPNLRKRKVLLICGMGWPQEVDQGPNYLLP